MKTLVLVVAIGLIALAGQASGAVYHQSDSIVGSDFYDSFDFQAIADPTNGRVNYVDKATAISQNLTYANRNSFILRSDSKSVLTPWGPGRDSVRIRSKKVYSDHVAVFNIRHMPQGCGTWPAVWETVESSWPNGGEIDILEGVNDQAPNIVALHTGPGCVMPALRSQTGTSTFLNCDANVNGNAGCVVKMPTAQSYGPSFNKNGGGWFAVARSNSAIKAWFWARDDPAVPTDVRHGSSSVQTDHWGTPTAHFPNISCNIAEHFAAHNIIINLTFCGDWAGNVYSQSGCPSSCNDYVNNNPAAFKNAYFDFASLRVYTP